MKQLDQDLKKIQQVSESQTKLIKSELDELQKDTIIQTRVLKKELDDLQKDTEDLEAETRKQTIVIVLTIIGIIITTVWQNAIQDYINYYFEIPKDALKMKLVFAVFITVLLIFLVYYLTKKGSYLSEKVPEKVPNQTNKPKSDHKNQNQK